MRLLILSLTLTIFSQTAFALDFDAEISKQESMTFSLENTGNKKLELKLQSKNVDDKKVGDFKIKLIKK